MSSSWKDGEGKWHRVYGKMKTRRKQRQAEAKVRQEETATRTPYQRDILLDDRLGKRIGADKERERISLLVKGG